MNAKYTYLGNISFSKSMEILNNAVESSSKNHTMSFMGLEYDKEYTMGVNFQVEHLLNNQITIHKIRRGGSITLHNKGQLVFYGTIPLSYVSGGLENMVRIYEQSIINVLWEYGIPAFVFPPYSGVFTPLGKIAFVGIGVKKNIIFHGIAINLYNDLTDYNPILSCGLNFPITKLENEKNIFNQKINTISMSKFSKQIYKQLMYFLYYQNLSSPYLYKDMLYNKISHTITTFPEVSLAVRLGLLYFNQKKYWEAHEVWEYFWLKYPKNNPFKIFLQGLILLASGLYKLQNKFNLKGGESLLQKALLKMEGNHYQNKIYVYTCEKQNIIHYIHSILNNIHHYKDICKDDIKNTILVYGIIYINQDLKPFTTK